MTRVSKMIIRTCSTVALATLISVTSIPTVSAHHAGPYPSGPEHAWGEMVYYPMVFPVDGTNSFSDSFYSSRAGGSIHHATDIMSPKMTPILAARGGTVRAVNWSHDADNIDYTRCCTLDIRYDDDWESWFIHINNDTPGTDDGRGALGPIVDGELNPAWGIAPGIVPGVHVDAGQLIGWVGDSGNAENTGPHLHFELIDPYGVRVNPFQALKDAEAGLTLPCMPGDTVCRVAGSDRFSTAAAVSLAEFPAGANTVFIATGADFPDALAGAAVAAELGAPLLLVGATGIPGPTATELDRLNPNDIVILGGEAAVSPQVEEALGEYGNVIRLSGSNRYATAAAISEFGFPGGANTVILATGLSFADALAGGPAAAELNGVVLLTHPTTLSPETLAEIERLDPSEIIILGGPSAVSLDIEDFLSEMAPTTRVYGFNRYATTAAISAYSFAPGIGELYIAVGTNFPDALAGGAAAGHAGSPMLIVEPWTIPPEIATEILRLDPVHITILGGPGAITLAVQLGFEDLLG